MKLFIVLFILTSLLLYGCDKVEGTFLKREAATMIFNKSWWKELANRIHGRTEASAGTSEKTTLITFSSTEANNSS